MRYKGIGDGCKSTNALEETDKIFDQIVTESSPDNETPPSCELCKLNCKGFRPSRKNFWEGKCARSNYERVFANTSLCLIEERRRV